MLFLPSFSSPKEPSTTPLFSFVQIDCSLFPVYSGLMLFSPVLPEKFLSVFEWCLHREGSYSIIGMPLAFPWALGLRMFASLGAISLLIYEVGAYVFQTELSWVSGGGLPTQILPRNVLMSGPCVSGQHMLCGDTLLSCELHISAWLFLFSRAA